MSLPKEHLRFAAIARRVGDEGLRRRHLLLAEVAQERCDAGICDCSLHDGLPSANPPRFPNVASEGARRSPGVLQVAEPGGRA